MGIKQQKIGKSWERQIIDAYFKKGYYVEKRPTQNTGTVYDIQVSRKGAVMFIEAKHIQYDKLYYKGSGLYKKRDELDNFVKRTKNNIYIFVKSDTDGYFFTTWVVARPILEQKGYIDKKDCIVIGDEFFE